jgi:hypothetical protein
LEYVGLPWFTLGPWGWLGPMVFSTIQLIQPYVVSGAAGRLRHGEGGAVALPGGAEHSARLAVLAPEPWSGDMQSNE